MRNKSKEIENLHITGYDALPSPGQIKEEYKLEGKILEIVKQGRLEVKDILERKDNRIIVVVGPCSIHNPDEAIEYARLLKPLADELLFGAIQSGGIIKVSVKKDKIDLNYFPKNKKTKKRKRDSVQ